MVFPGLGHFYVGEVRRGIEFAVGGFVNVLLIFGYVGFLTFPLWWILGAVDAYQGARNRNAARPSRPSIITRPAWALIHTGSFFGCTLLLAYGFHPRAEPWLVWGAVAVAAAAYLFGLWTILRRGPVRLIFLAALVPPIMAVIVELAG